MTLPSAPIFGPGVDGACNFDGTATVLGLAPTTSGSFKVYTLTRDIFPSSVAIGANVKIFAANWRIFCQTSITGSSSATSIIHNDGNAAPIPIINGAIVQATATPAGFYAATRAGNNGSTGNETNLPPPPYAVSSSGVSAPAGGPNSAPNGNTPTNPMMGGSGGATAQATNGVAGAVGGSVTVLPSENGMDPSQLLMGRVAGQTVQYHSASGGGSGSKTNAGSGGVIDCTAGGGGAGGGWIVVAAQTISNVTISADGGRGADGNVTGADIGTGRAASGGGGGGGGMCIVHYGTRSSCVFRANGGAGGNGATGGSGCFAGNGGSGSSGHVFAYNLSGDGT